MNNPIFGASCIADFLVMKSLSWPFWSQPNWTANKTIVANHGSRGILQNAQLND